MLDYMIGPENSENGMICYYGDEDILEHAKRKMEEEDESFDKGARKKRYILGQNVGKWTEEEHSRFVLALKKFGRNWTLVQQEVKTRTLVQIRSHAQKYFLKKVRGIAPSNVTMDSKLISTASDGIVPTWLLQDDSNYANKSSVNTNINGINLSNCDNSGKSGSSNNDVVDSGNCNHGRLKSEINSNKNAACCPNSNLKNGIGLRNMNIQTKTAESNIYRIYDQDSSGDDIIENNIELGCGINISENDGIGISRKILDGVPNDHISYSGISNSSSTSLLIDDYNRDCFSYQNNEYKDDYLNDNNEIEAIKYDYKNDFSTKKILNNCSDKNPPFESNSMFSTAVSSPASLCPEKNYVPASTLILDTLLMPPTVDIDNTNIENNQNQHDFQVNFYNNLTESNIKSDCISDNSLNYCFNENERIANPHISLCDVPWPITGSDQFLNFNDNSVSTPSPSPSSSSSISYFDLDASGNDSKQFSNNEFFSPNKHYEMNNSLSDFVYCGDSLGIDILNTYSGYRDTTNPIINTSDANYII
ncbi:Myb domain containing protein [Cryptosporidium ryanae]|uniref:Myb domain containing protein n=1 Tax=Cryptosporidium ryanae TaxID=515981 RepID=UPI003519E0E4|nr:Myb domain containing protein [Cryptosporidium ryanae]